MECSKPFSSKTVMEGGTLARESTKPEGMPFEVKAFIFLNQILNACLKTWN